MCPFCIGLKEISISFVGFKQPGWPSGKASTSGAEDPGFESRLRRNFFGVIPETKKIGTPVTTLPGTWRYRVGAGTGWPGVSIL